FALHGAFTDETHAVAAAAQHARFHKRFLGDRAVRLEAALVDRSLHAADIDRHDLEREDIGEAALRQPAVNRHLAAFEPLDAYAGARLLALDAAARSLAHARADAASHAHAELAGAFPVGELIELHRFRPTCLRPRARDD